MASHVTLIVIRTLDWKQIQVDLEEYQEQVSKEDLPETAC
jgi:hypothetical protein